MKPPESLETCFHDWKLDLSLIIPVRNEAGSIGTLKQEIDETLCKSQYAWECLWIDDGSDDDTLPLMKSFHHIDSRHHYVSLEKQSGQSAALHVGFHMATGRILATMDGDGQNDPADLPSLLTHLTEKKLDLVNGVRKKRQDNPIRRLSSRIANGFRNWLTRESVSDVGCSLRVFRHDSVMHITPFNGMHRFLPTLIRIHGFNNIDELPVSHRPRLHGHTKYGIHNRLWVGIADTLAVRWMQKRIVFARPAETSNPKDKGTP